MVQAKTIREALLIRRANYAILDHVDGPYGTAIGAKDGLPVVQVFVERKIHENWLSEEDIVPKTLEHAGKKCATDVFEVGGDLNTPYEPGRIEGGRLTLRQRLRGGDAFLQPGSQLSFQDKEGIDGRGTLAAFARCRRTKKLGLLTNQHVGVFVGNVLTHPGLHSPIVARVTRMIDMVPASHYWKDATRDANAHLILDCAFAELTEPYWPVQTEVPWVDDFDEIQYSSLGTPRSFELDDASLWPIGENVFSVGRSQVDQDGIVQGVAYQYADGPHTSYFTDLLITSTQKDGNGWFSKPGDSGKLVIADDGAVSPVGLLWGGSLLRTNPSLELVDHSFAVSVTTIQDALEVDIVSTLPYQTEPEQPQGNDLAEF